MRWSAYRSSVSDVGMIGVGVDMTEQFNLNNNVSTIATCSLVLYGCVNMLKLASSPQLYSYVALLVFCPPFV